MKLRFLASTNAHAVAGIVRFHGSSGEVAGALVKTFSRLETSLQALYGSLNPTFWFHYW